MAKVTGTILPPVHGISEQPVLYRSDGQAKDLVNAYIDTKDGMKKRAGTNALGSTTVSKRTDDRLLKSHYFTYRNESYYLLLVDGLWPQVFNARTGESVTVTRDPTISQLGFALYLRGVEQGARGFENAAFSTCLLYTSPSPRDS